MPVRIMLAHCRLVDCLAAARRAAEQERLGAYLQGLERNLATRKNETSRVDERLAEARSRRSYKSLRRPAARVLPPAGRRQKIVQAGAAAAASTDSSTTVLRSPWSLPAKARGLARGNCKRNAPCYRGVGDYFSTRNGYIRERAISESCRPPFRRAPASSAAPIRNLNPIAIIRVLNSPRFTRATGNFFASLRLPLFHTVQEHLNAFLSA